MEKVRIKIHRIRSSYSLPTSQTQGSSGCDLRADIEKPIILEPRSRTLIPTGISLSIPLGYEAQVRPRSGLALNKGITVANAPGTIDSDYRGEIKVILINLGEEAVTIEPGDRVAQLVFQRVFSVQWEEVSILDETARGEGGFGHTGIKEKTL